MRVLLRAEVATGNLMVVEKMLTAIGPQCNCCTYLRCVLMAVMALVICVGCGHGGGSSQVAPPASSETSGKPPEPPLATTTPVAAPGPHANPASLVWVSIPGGSFNMGSTGGRWTTPEGIVMSNEEPIHSVSVGAFEIGKTEVTIGQYGSCSAAGACKLLLVEDGCNAKGPDRDLLPAACVDWTQARGFCMWAGGRLCTEAEWEYAARNGSQEDDYPWGGESPKCRLAVIKACGVSRPLAPCSKMAGVNKWGVCDLSGNLTEWVEDDWHMNYIGAPTDSRAWTRDTHLLAMTRGGAYRSPDEKHLRSANRGNSSIDYVGRSLGVRCCRIPD